MKLTSALILLLFAASGLIYGQSTETDTSAADDGGSRFKKENLDLNIYGEIFYSIYDWETYTDKNNAIDFNRIVFAPVYHFNDKLKLELEVEFEHGGTGTEMEFDKFEEFGEFEQEIDKGGEVLIEEMELAYEAHSWLELKAGKLKVPVGFVAATDEPLEYFTSTYNNVEETLIPTAWYNYGIGAEGELHNWKYNVVIVNALDNSQFSSANWIKRGSLERFETVGADAFAAAARIDYKLNSKSEIGVSGYIGNSTPNRPKEDITDDAYVGIADAHMHTQFNNLKFNALFFYGNLQNADIVSDANRNLSNNLNVKRTPVGSTALGYFAEAAFDILSLTSVKKSKLDIFAGYYYYDTMHKITGDVFDNPRWERSEIRTGLSYIWNEHIALKSDATFRTLNIPTSNKEITYTTALAFQF